MLTRPALRFLLLAVTSLPVSAQLPFWLQSKDQDGIGIYSASVGPSYYNLSLSNSVAGPGGLGSYSSDLLTSTSVTVGWTRKRPESTFSLLYTPTYLSYARNSNLNRFNHSLQIQTDRPFNLSRRLTFRVSISANTTDFQQSLFAAAGPESLVTSSGYFDSLSVGGQGSAAPADLGDGVVLGTGVAQTLIYGNRVLNASAQGTLTYRHSSRLSISSYVALSRNQTLGQVSNSGAGGLYLVPQTTSGTLGFDLSYSLTPRTQISMSNELTESFSRFLNAWNNNSFVSIGHNVSRHWFVRANAGAGSYFGASNGAKTGVLRGVQTIAGASLGYKTLSQVFTGSYLRSLTSYYGVGGNMSSTAVAWRWQKPSRSWAMLGGFTDQSFDSGQSTKLNSWYANLGLSRRLGDIMSAQLQYSYMNFSGPFLTTPVSFTQNGLMLSISWTPAKPVL